MRFQFQSYGMSKAGLCCLIGNVFLVAVIAVPALAAQETGPANVVRAVQSDNASVRLSAVLFLANLGPKARERVPGDPDASLKALRAAGPSIAKLVRDPDPNIRRPAVLALAWTRAPGAVAGAAWLEALKDADVSVRAAAAGAIGNHIERTADEVGRSPSNVELWQGIAEWAEDVKGFVEPLAAGLRDPDPAVQRTALQSLSQLITFLPTRVKEVSPVDTAATPEEAAATQASFVAFKKSLPGLATAFKSMTPQLVALVRKSEPVAAVAAAEAIEQLAELIRENGGGTGRGRLLRTDLDPEGLDAAKVVREALQQALPDLTEGLKRPNRSIQLAVIEALEMMDTSAKAAAPALLAALQSQSPFVRWSAARVLGKFGPTDDPKIVLGLARLLEDEDVDVRVFAAQVLGKFGRRAAAATPMLSRALNNGLDTELQEQALKTLTAIGPEAKQALPSVIIAARSSDLRVRRLIPTVLSKFGSDAKPAIAALQSLLADDDLEVRQAAAQALLRIQGFDIGGVN